VRIDSDASAGEATAIDDACVVAGIAGEEVFRAHERGDRGGVGGEAAGKGEGGVDSEQVG
jgi:hypothetical protein